MLNIILYLWQLPQNLLGLLLCLIYRAEKSLIYKGRKIRVCSYFPGGISLGNYVFVKGYPNNTRTWNIVKHKWGHTRQSHYLGWLYLLAIGFPSVLGNLYDTLFHRNWDIERSRKWYFNQPWEKWADQLGEVKRFELCQNSSGYAEDI